MHRSAPELIFPTQYLEIYIDMLRLLTSPHTVKHMFCGIQGRVFIKKTFDAMNYIFLWSNLM